VDQKGIGRRVSAVRTLTHVMIAYSFTERGFAPRPLDRRAGRVVPISRQGSTNASAREKPFLGQWPESIYKDQLDTVFKKKKCGTRVAHAAAA
jgi:hypothetical protein